MRETWFALWLMKSRMNYYQFFSQKYRKIGNFYLKNVEFFQVFLNKSDGLCVKMMRYELSLISTV